MSKVQKIFISFQRTNLIRGLAIIAVVIIHILAYFPGIYNSEKQLFFISIDQLARFCVPAFIMLSGYGLATKYENQKIEYLDFFKKRVFKLLPLYLLWSFASILIISSVSAWSYGNQPMSLWIQLLFGQADYQLYFLPVLFQLYALFPLLWLLRKKPKLLLFLTLLIQVTLYITFAATSSKSDRFQYTLSLSWIGYFAFGIYLKLKTLPKLLVKLAPVLSALVFGAIVFICLKQINNGIDPLPVLKFTKLSIILFGLSFCLSLVTIKLPANKLLLWLGKNSYIIFLSHTILMRIIYAMITKQLSTTVLFGVITLWGLTLFLSLFLLDKQKTKSVIKS
ncbi:MAG TPA: hypothetical protein DCW58_02755 [Candidatus Pacebacteria bacterium]|nr:hypothetical protein [Candidatus Paceibacterota bacterium]